MLENLNFNDLKILKSFAHESNIDNYNLMDAKGVFDIIEIAKFSHTKIRNSIRLLVKLGLLKEGFKKGNAKTYLLTEDGWKIVNGELE